MKDCERIATLLVLQPAELRLTSDAERSVALHIAACPYCRERFHDLDGFNRWFVAWSKADGSEVTELGALPGDEAFVRRILKRLGRLGE